MDGTEPTERRPADWSTRFGAWLIDVVLVAALVGVVGDVLGIGPGLLSADAPYGLGRNGLVLFAYWTLFESRTGQSPGKMALDLCVVRRDGQSIDLADAAIQSFGKAFLLPLDVLVGVLAMPGEGQRLFNRLSGTRVVAVDAHRPRNRGATAVEA